MSFEIDVPPEMRQVYIERRRADLQAGRQAIEAKDFGFFEKLGHQIKGNAQSFGFEGLSPIAIALEVAAQKKNIVEVKLAFEDFVRAVEDLKVSSS
jgi:HPt (histidine-containing phosphotransfer) domain-containing protein